MTDTDYLDDSVEYASVALTDDPNEIEDINNKINKLNSSARKSFRRLTKLEDVNESEALKMANWTPERRHAEIKKLKKKIS
jgi:hypothetical protein